MVFLELLPLLLPSCKEFSAAANYSLIIIIGVDVDSEKPFLPWHKYSVIKVQKENSRVFCFQAEHLDEIQMSVWFGSVRIWL